jgi:hypothetical protein
MVYRDDVVLDVDTLDKCRHLNLRGDLSHDDQYAALFQEVQFH